MRDIYYVDEKGIRHDKADTWGLEKKRQFLPIGWLCPECKKVTLDINKDSKQEKQSALRDQVDTPTDLECPACLSTDYRKNGKHQDTGKQRYKCNKCGKNFS